MRGCENDVHSSCILYKTTIIFVLIKKYKNLHFRENLFGVRPLEKFCGQSVQSRIT